MTSYREAERELENDPMVGPPPPSVVAEVASANDAERFEEVIPCFNTLNVRKYFSLCKSL